jgi:hypothetical protein
LQFDRLLVDVKCCLKNFFFDEWMPLGHFNIEIKFADVIMQFSTAALQGDEYPLAGDGFVLFCETSLSAVFHEIILHILNYSILFLCFFIWN